MLGKEVARLAERGVGRSPCGSSLPNGNTRMARGRPWSLQRHRDWPSGWRPWAKAVAGPAAATASWT